MHNEVVAKVFIDTQDIEIVNKYKWYLGNDGYARSGDKPLYMHRIIMSAENDDVVDHINRNPLDNRRENLRLCTNSKNMMNRGLQNNNTSGVTGVVWHKTRERWCAQIKINNKHTNLGRFLSKDDAIRARLTAEKELFKEYAPQKHLFEEYNI